MEMTNQYVFTGTMTSGGTRQGFKWIAGLALLVSAALMLYAVLRPRPKYRHQ